jgi:hypothetical protein
MLDALGPSDPDVGGPQEPGSRLRPARYGRASRLSCPELRGYLTARAAAPHLP